MANIVIPPVAATGATLRLIRLDQPIRFFGGAEVIMAAPEAIWHLQFPLKTYRRTEVRAWHAALIRLSKLSNTFQIVPPGWESGTGFSGTDPTVNGAGQLGTDLIISGTPNTALALTGDFIEVNGELKMLIGDLNIAGGGGGVASFEPALRQPPPHGSTVRVKQPRARMRLAEPIFTTSIRIPDFYDTTIDAIETWGP